MFKALGAVLASGLVLIGAQAPAGAADTRAATRFSELAVTPATVDVDHPTVTYTGRLVYADADGAEQGLADATLCMRKDSGCLVRVKTDADGRFTASVTLTTAGDHPGMVEGNVGATFSGDAAHLPITVQDIYLHVAPTEARISLTFEPAPSVIGDPVDAVGLVERRTPDGGWTPVADQTVRVFVGDTQVALGMTATDGRYRITATVPGSGSWHVETPQVYPRVLPYGPANGPYLGARADSGPWTARHRTAVTGFNAAPEPVGKGATITATGQVVRYAADGSAEPATCSPTLQFSADGKTWTSVLGGTTDANGRFTVKTPAVRDGYWRAVTQESGDGDLPATSGTDYVDVRYRTSITGFNAAPEPIRKGGRLTVSGTLKRDTTAWKAFSGQSVKIYFKADGATTWTYEGTSKTSSTGHFSHTFTASKDGTWRASYAGNGTYLTVTGSGDHVDVR